MTLVRWLVPGLECPIGQELPGHFSSGCLDWPVNLKCIRPLSRFPSMRCPTPREPGALHPPPDPDPMPCSRHVLYTPPQPYPFPPALVHPSLSAIRTSKKKSIEKPRGTHSVTSIDHRQTRAEQAFSRLCARSSLHSLALPHAHLHFTSFMPASLPTPPKHLDEDPHDQAIDPCLQNVR